MCFRASLVKMTKVYDAQDSLNAWGGGAQLVTFQFGEVNWATVLQENSYTKEEVRAKDSEVAHPRLLSRRCPKDQ